MVKEKGHPQGVMVFASRALYVNSVVSATSPRSRYNTCLMCPEAFDTRFVFSSTI